MKGLKPVASLRSLRERVTEQNRLGGILALLLFAIAVLWCLSYTRAKLFEPTSLPVYREVIGPDSHGIISTRSVPATLPREDVTEILRLVRREMGRTNGRGLRGWLYSCSSIRTLPEEIRSRMQEHISGITVKADDTVEIYTTREHRQFGFHDGANYRLKQGTNGWEIISRGWWIE